MTRYIDLCAGQIRVILNDDGTVTWDGGNATRSEVLGYLTAKLEAIDRAAEIATTMINRLVADDEKERSK